MVFYLKYRPQKIIELDSERVRDALIQVLSLPQIPHAFLFTGPKGLGKTSAARILAKAVNCEGRAKSKGQRAKGKEQVSEHTLSPKPSALSLTLEPCNKCEQCVSITNGTNLDILEIDAASNRGIDEIRDLREKIKLSPVSAHKKVYIIDEVHMLTTEAFNALLKTLEEPPSHAMFILCTTELAKVPVTIQSRCFQIKFTPASKEDIARSFKRIMDSEKIEITSEVIEEISKLADGGFRDAHKILEELVAMGEKDITLELVEKKYKVVSSKYQVVSILKSLEKRDVKSGLKTIQDIVDQGMDIKRFTQQLTEAVHGLLLEKAGVGEWRMENGEWRIEEIRELLILLNKALIDMKYAVLPQLPLELAIIDWGGIQLGAKGIEQRVESEEEEKDLRFKIQESRENQTMQQSVNNQVEVETKITTKSEKSGVTVTTMRKQVGDLVRVKALYGEKPDAKSSEAPRVNSDFSLLNISNSELTKEWINNFWHVYILEIKQYNHTIAGVLRSCQINQFDKEKLVIETAYKFHKERLSDVKTREILENVCKTLTGSAVKVEIVLKQ